MAVKAAHSAYVFESMCIQTVELNRYTLVVIVTMFNC